MLISPGLTHGPSHRNIMASLPSLLAWYDSVLSQPVIQEGNKIDSIYDLSGNGHHLRVRTEAGKINPTYDQNVFGSLPGIGNSLQGQKVELRGDVDIRPYTPEQQTWFFVYMPYVLTSYRILSLGSNYETPMDHSSGFAWGRDQGNGFPKTYLSLLGGAVCSCRFQNANQLFIRVNGMNAPNPIDPKDTYFSTSNVRNIHLFTGYNLNAVQGAFGSVAFCMEALPLTLIEKVERYLSQRFSIPLNV